MNLIFNIFNIKMEDIKHIKEFCNNSNKDLLDSFPQIIKKMFLKYARICLEKYKKSNKYTLLAKNILDILVYIPNTKRGKVYIGSFSRGKNHIQIPGVKNINATSGSMNKINGIKATQISPMYLGPVNNKILSREMLSTPIDAPIFENYWQYGKIFKELKHLDEKNNTTDTWVKFRNNGYKKLTGDRHPKGTKSDKVDYTYKKGDKTFNKWKYYNACCSEYYSKNGRKETLDYIKSRKRVYVPVYASMVRDTEFFNLLKKQVDNGHNILILDYDGPRNVDYLEVKIDMLKEKINDKSAPFGHGYVIAGLLASIEPYHYI
jgi:hypothetical protein